MARKGNVTSAFWARPIVPVKHTLVVTVTMERTRMGKRRKRKKNRWGKIGPPHSEKRRRHLKRIAKKGGRASARARKLKRKGKRKRKGNPDPAVCGFE